MGRTIALLQLDPKVGDLAGNVERIEQLARIAHSAGAQCAVSTELAISGYPPRDLLLRSEFVDNCMKAAQQIDTPMPILVGTPLRPSSDRRLPGNGVVRCDEAGVREVVRKQLLPTYDVFDEARYFAPGRSSGLTRSIGGIDLGVTVCEDAWQHSGHTPADYECDPIAQMADWSRQGMSIDATVNLSASPYHLHKSDLRSDMASKAAKTLGHPFILVNQVGGNDDLIFDGRSLVAWPDGRVDTAPGWQEGVLIVDLDESSVEWIGEPEPNCDDLLSAVTTGLAGYCQKSGLDKVVLGLSGGIDSAVCAAVAARALGPENVIGISMPSRHSSQHSKDDAAATAQALGIEYQIRPIDQMHELAEQTMSDELETGHAVAAENLQSRLRALFVMGVANARGAMALATGNKSELAMGYCTLYGDMAGGYAPLGDLLKTEVYELAKSLNSLTPDDPPINSSTMQKPPSAELAPDQKDEDNLPPYATLDAILESWIERGVKSTEHDRETVDWVIKRLHANEHKRWQMPPAPRVSQRAFGQGWRQALASHSA